MNMNTKTVHDRIKILIEETNDAYGNYETVNADYAEFATLALSEFKHVLRDPNLTGQQLKQMLREGSQTHYISTQKAENWSSFMAYHVTRASNRNMINKI